MTILRHRILWVSLGMILLSSIVLCQETRIDRSEFLASMRKSETATKGIPYRTRTTIETGPTHNGPWQPYSSMVEERVVPDRSHLIYTSRNRGEYIRVGRSTVRGRTEAGQRILGRLKEYSLIRLAPLDSMAQSSSTGFVVLKVNPATML